MNVNLYFPRGTYKNLKILGQLWKNMKLVFNNQCSTWNINNLKNNKETIFIDPYWNYILVLHILCTFAS